jgi:hypothetical protein
MTSRAVRERLAQDVSLWQVDGLVGDAAAQVLRERYDAPGFGLATAAKYLGIVGALLAGFGILGAVGALSGSLLLGALELLAVAAGFLLWGLRLAQDPRGRAEQSSRAVLAVGLFALAAAGAVGAQGAGAGSGPTIAVTGLVTVPVAFVLAYRFRNGFLLVLALLATFHWIGSWSEMMGRSTYALEIQDPRVMALAATAATVVGWLHRTGRIPGPARFDAVWMAVGLLYLDLSLLVLGTFGHDELAWIAVWFAAAIAQIVAGAAMKSAVPIGFGVTALAVNLFTRYYEHFWDRLAKGLFFLLGGALLFGFGFACERLARRAGYGGTASEGGGRP